MQAIAVHTFAAVIWGTRSQYFTTYTVVGLTWLYIGLSIALNVTLNTHGSSFYEKPVGVSTFFQCFQLVSLMV
jgi:hypothetical protein